MDPPLLTQEFILNIPLINYASEDYIIEIAPPSFLLEQFSNANYYIINLDSRR